MSQQKINYSQPNDNLGDTLRNAFVKTDANFDELYQNKVDKITGKGLSDVNFSQADKTKLDAIDASAKVQSDFNQNDNLQPDFIKNKPTLLSEFDNDLEFIEDVQTGGQYVRESGQWVAIDTNQLLSRAEITITGNDVEIAGATRYVINETAYEILTPETFTINYTAAGLFRSDIIVVDVNGDYLLISGVEGAVAIKPDVPIGTLEFAEFDVTDSSITEVVDVTNFWVTKADKSDFNIVKNGTFTIYKNQLNTNPLTLNVLEILDVAIGWLPNTQIFIPVGQYLGGDVTDINNWNTSPMDFTI